MVDASAARGSEVSSRSTSSGRPWLRFFVQNPFLDTVHYGLNHRLHTESEVRVSGCLRASRSHRATATGASRLHDARTDTGDPAPSRSSDWHTQLGRERHTGPMQWKSSGSKQAESDRGREQSKNMRRWTIIELLNSEALVQEGRDVRHCIAYLRPGPAQAGTARCGACSVRMRKVGSALSQSR